MEEPTELQKLQWENKALRNALQYLVDTKKRKETIGKDSIYMSRQRLGWMKAESLLRDEPEWLLFEGNENLFEEAANSNCLCKFDDGTVCRYNDKHPFAVLTYFKV